ncbi:MAG: hypothetical protein RM368_33790 [Nostoc sp. DedSLP03]|nr:hypothetical protein [Nostoc sp. DedSLP03]
MSTSAKSFVKSRFQALGWKCTSIGLLLRVREALPLEQHSQSEQGNKATRQYLKALGLFS